MRTPVVAVVTSRASPCRCGAAWTRAIHTLGLRGLRVAAEGMAARRQDLADAALVLEYADTYRGSGELRPLLRHQLASWGARLAGAPAAAAQVLDDKIAAREALRRAGIAVPAGRLLTAEHLGNGRGFPFPAVVKRPFEHGSRGVARADDRAALGAVASRWLARGDAALLVEELVEGRELAVTVVEGERGPRPLPPVEVGLPAGVLYTRRRKWSRRSARLRPAELGPREAAALRDAALAAFRATGLRDLARFDLKLSGETPVFLEANVRPSVERGSAVRIAASAAGLDFAGLARLVLLSAARRHGLADVVRRLR